MGLQAERGGMDRNGGKTSKYRKRTVQQKKICIYIYMVPPPRPILSQNLLVFALFCCFLLCLNVCFFLASILYFQKVV